MPPASLSTLAVMNPGPTTARNSAMRVRHCFSVVGTSAVPQHRNHVVGRDDPGEPAVLVGDCQREQVVLVEQLRYFLLWRVGRAGCRLLADRPELHVWRRDGDSDE